MKINSAITSVGTGPTAASAARTRPASQATPQAVGGGGEHVELSSLSARLQEAATMAATPGIDVSRVGEIRQAISEGRFRVNPERVADGLLDSVRQMLARQQD